MSVTMGDFVEQSKHCDGSASKQRCQAIMFERFDLVEPNLIEEAALDAVNLF